MIAVSDEIIAANQFPVLSNFETPFEPGRWNGGAGFVIVESVQGSDKPAMQMNLSTRQVYSGVGMQYLVADWSDYEYLNLDIFYP